MDWLIAPVAWLGIILGEALPPAPETVMALPPELAARIERDIVAATASPAARIDRLTEYMFLESGLGFDYQDLPTRNAAGTWSAGRGNCLSFTLLFLAMAREAGLNAFPREVRVPESRRRDGTIVFSIGHVNVGVEGGGRRATVDFEPDLMRAQRLAASFRGQRISDARALAHFYNNRAAELLTEGQARLARLWIEQALALDPDLPAAINTLGVIERKLGDPSAAEAAFERVLAMDDDNINALLNLIGLLQGQGRTESAAAYRQRVSRLRAQDPWFQLELGHFHESLGAYEQAREHYWQAVQLSERPDALMYARLARVLDRMGERSAAKRYLVQAVRHSDVEERKGYAEKLYAFKSASPK
ncbi:MAG: hypothetical protein HND55_01045 [Pseudomonadota bacterium]|nr:MAG: hypothetical protein HND55_01045 [Pseudomonadota bacterium]